MKRVFKLVLVLFITVLFSGCTDALTKSNKSGLQVYTNDIPAAVFLDGQHLDKTPYINKELKPGQYLLKIQPDDSSLVPYETTINLRKGLLTVVTWKAGTRPELSGGVVYELEKLASSSQTELSVVSIPDGAIVSIDQGETQFSPVLMADVEPGTHEVTVSQPSYETQSHTVNVVEGHRLEVLVKLAKNPSETATQESEVSPKDSNLEEAKPSPSPVSESEDTTEDEAPDLNIDLSAEIAGPTVTITSTNFFQNGEEVLRVRDAASSAGKELGFAVVGTQYAYLEESTAGWYKIDFEGEEGWISSRYATLNE